MAKKKIVIPDKATVEAMVAEYKELKKQEKIISERKSLLADTIKAFVVENGTKDSNGSYYSENETFVFGAQCRKSVSFNVPTAVKFFEDKGFDDCVELVPSINDSAVEARLSSGDITPDEIESITKTKTTMAIDVREKKEVVIAQQASAIIAAQKKKPLLKKKK